MGAATNLWSILIWTEHWHSDAKGLKYPEEVLDPNNHYYRDLEPHSFMIELAQTLIEDGYEVGIISAADKNTIRDKYEWLQQYMSFVNEDNICFCPIGADKNEYVKGNAEKSILIDDYHKNLEEWRGTSIKAINSVNSVDYNMVNILAYAAEQGTTNWDKQMAAVLHSIKTILYKQNRDKTLPDKVNAHNYEDAKENTKPHKTSNDYERD